MAAPGHWDSHAAQRWRHFLTWRAISSRDGQVKKKIPSLTKRNRLRPRFFCIGSIHFWGLCRYLTIGRRNYLSKELAGGEVSMDCISFLGLQKPMELLISIIIIILTIIITDMIYNMCVVFRFDFSNKTRPPEAKNNVI